MNINNSLKSLLLMSLLSAFTMAVHAEPMHQYTLKLKSLKALHQQEDAGDELYFSVTEYPKGKTPRYYQIPSFPTHWLTKYLPQVNDVTLWQKTAKECEETEVIVSLIEEDYVPWNVDDLFGSVRLKISCNNGKMTSSWEIPNSSNTLPITTDKNSFNFVGDKGSYMATFAVKSGKSNTAQQPIPESNIDTIQQRYLMIP